MKLDSLTLDDMLGEVRRRYEVCQQILGITTARKPRKSPARVKRKARSTVGPGRPRKGQLTLKKALQKVLQNPMTAAEAVKKLPSVGYHSSAKSLRTHIGNMVRKNKADFKVVKPGVYMATQAAD